MATRTDHALGKLGFAIIDAAYDWALGDQGWTRAGDHWFLDGYRLSHPDEHGRHSRMTGPDGSVVRNGADQWTSRVLVPINRRVRAAFQPWFGIPDAAGLEQAVAQLADASARLCPDARLRSGRVVAGNDRLSAVSTLQDSLATFHGEAIFAFKKDYADKLPRVLRGQLAVVGLLAAAVRAEQKILRTAQHDLLVLATQCREAMRNRGGSGSIDLGIVGLGLSVVGLVAGGGPVGTLVAAGEVAVDVLGEFEKPAPRRVIGRFTGGSVDAVLDQLEKALHGLSESIEDHERAVGRRLNDTKHRLGTFDLRTMDRLTRTTSIDRLGLSDPHDDDLDAHDRHEIRADLTVLRQVAALMAPLGHELTVAAGFVGGAVAEHPWRRNPRVGMGDDGPFDEWRHLADALVDLLHETGDELVAGGDHLRTATHLLELSEHRVETQLRRHRDRVGASLD